MTTNATLGLFKSYQQTKTLSLLSNIVITHATLKGFSTCDFRYTVGESMALIISNAGTTACQIYSAALPSQTELFQSNPAGAKFNHCINQPCAPMQYGITLTHIYTFSAFTSHSAT